MWHPSHESDEVGTVDIYEDPEISSCIEETMAAIEDGSFEEPEDDWREEIARSSISHGLMSNQSPNLPIWWN